LLPRERFAFAENAIELRNPLSEEAVALRPSILGGLLAVLDRNIRAGAARVAIFEIGRTFIPPKGKEERHLGVLLWEALRAQLTGGPAKIEISICST
jgi:phenylalanyl-tRNA synthetase beta subunit